MKLIKKNSFIKFDRQLPVYTWMYPLDSKAVPSQNISAILKNLNTDHVRTRALYFHIPFCDTICSFCPFTRGLFKDEDTVEKYVDALTHEIEIKASYPAITKFPINSIFFGGGTPSILSPKQIRRIGKAIHEHFDLSKLVEFNFEIEVKSITEEKCVALREIGVNKLRFGLQTFSKKYRDYFTLTATLENIYNAVDLINKYFEFLCVDMMYGMNGQTIEEFTSDIQQAVNLKVNNIDFYPINNVITQLRLHKSFRNDNLPPKSALEKLQMKVYLDQYLRACGFLPHNGHGFVRAKAGNLAENPVVTDEYLFKYHETVMGSFGDELIGFGNAAISTTTEYGIVNVDNRLTYMKDILSDNCVKAIVSTNKGLPYNKAVTLKLPYFGHIDKSEVNWDLIEPEVKDSFQELVEADLIKESNQNYVLTKLGWYWYVNIMYYLMPVRERNLLDQYIAAKLKDQSRLSGEMEIKL